MSSTVASLRDLWEMWLEWEQLWGAWRQTQFGALQLAPMERATAALADRLQQVGDKPREWPLWKELSHKVTGFQQLAPLIASLSSPALRPRHWAQLKQRFEARFDPEAASFTLEFIAGLGLALHAEFIVELSATAGRELAFERALEDLRDKWAAIGLTFAPYKTAYIRLGPTDDITAQLDDDQVRGAHRHHGRQLLAAWVRCCASAR